VAGPAAGGFVVFLLDGAHGVVEQRVLIRAEFSQVVAISR
jgi:hypothetical protein